MFRNILIISYFLIITDSTDSTLEPCLRDTYPIESLPSKTSSSLPPAKLTINPRDSEVNVLISNQHENFDLILFANPFIKDKPDHGCPPLNTTDDNVRRYNKVCRVPKDEGVRNMTFGQIFTGCHYFIMINRERQQRWDVSDFYKTSYQYLDTRVTINRTYITPETLSSSMQIGVTFDFPLDCIRIVVNLYEIPKTEGNALVAIEKGKLPKVQSCTIKIKRSQKIATSSAGCTLLKNITARAVSPEARKKGGKWIVYLTWANLTYGDDHSYYLQYSNTDLEYCEKQYPDIKTWGLMKARITKYLNVKLVSATPKTSSPEGYSPWLWTGYGFSGFILTIIAFCGIWMWRRLLCHFCKKNGSYEVPTPPTKPTGSADGNDILLVYEKGCPSDEELKTFKCSLRQGCRGCKIRDVYAPSEFEHIVGDVKKWIGEILEAKNKVIWIDTPQLRSRFNDIGKYRTRDDFRDQAATHAVALAKSLYQDANTQYRRHFVVWWEGYEVDDRHDGPFRLVSPYVRFLLPRQSAELCNHLNSSTESLEHDEELELKSLLNSEIGSGVSQTINIRELA